MQLRVARHTDRLAAVVAFYWAEHGLSFEDADGFRVVLVPERWDG
jgi:hypothetical protein